MDSNNRNGGNNGGNKKNNRNLRSVLSLIGWALVLTLVFNYILAMTSGGKSFEITYSQMMNLVQEDQIILSCLLGLAARPLLAPSISKESSP